MTGIREAIEKSFEAVTAPEEPGQQAALSPPPPEAAAPGTEPAAPQSNRDERGKFKAKTAETAPATEIQPPATTTAEADKGLDPSATGEPSKQPTAAIAAPVSWGADAKEVFAKLPPDMQAEVSRRESEREKALGVALKDSADTKKRYGDMEQSFQAHTQRLALRGEAPPQAARRLLDLEAAFEREPAAVIQHLAKQAGINLAALVPQAGVQTPGYDVNDLDPALRGVLAEVNELKQARLQEHQRQQEGISRQNATTVEAFRAETGDNGLPKYPHFTKLEEDVAREVLMLKGTNPHLSSREYIEKAYDAAVWKNPETRAQMLEAQKQSFVQTRQTEERTRTSTTAATAAVRGNGGGQVQTPKPKGMAAIRSVLEKNFENVT